MLLIMICGEDSKSKERSCKSNSNRKKQRSPEFSVNMFQQPALGRLQSWEAVAAAAAVTTVAAAAAGDGSLLNLTFVFALDEVFLPFVFGEKLELL